MACHQRRPITESGSSHSQVAIDTVLDRPWPEGTTIRVLAAVPYPYALATVEWYMPQQSLAEVDEQSKRHAQSTVDAAAIRLRERGFAVDTVLRDGDPRTAIVQEASDWNADLIVVGSHGHTGLRKLLLGSVAQHVVAHAPCSVEVARRRDESARG